MKFDKLPFLLALSLVSGAAAASVPSYPLTPGITITPISQSAANYTGTVSHNGAVNEFFSDSYNIDFTQYCAGAGCVGDELSFKVSYTNLIPLGQNLNSMNMSLFDVTNATQLWSLPVTIDQQVPGLFTVGSAFNDAFYLEGMYRLDVTGAGSGAYAVTLTVPEPETWAVFLAGLAVLGLRLSKRLPNSKSV
jgi:hypothetical protein